VFGVMGGEFQPMGHVNVVSRLYDHGLDPQQALNLPRAMPTKGVVELEEGFSPGVVSDLARWGHRFAEPEEPHGSGQIIRRDGTSGWIAGTDPRKDGLAAGN
jgi:gamma-glutamyltranspeptidase / glutathione hydrolase